MEETQRDSVRMVTIRQYCRVWKISNPGGNLHAAIEFKRYTARMPEVQLGMSRKQSVVKDNTRYVHYSIIYHHSACKVPHKRHRSRYFPKCNT